MHKRMAVAAIVTLAALVVLSVLTGVALADEPVRPSGTPPGERGGPPFQWDWDYHASGNPAYVYCYYTVWDPYKSGSDAVGKAWTKGTCICWQPVYQVAEAWLWYWHPYYVQFYEWAHDQRSSTNPPNSSGQYAMAIRNGWGSTYYVTTSAHSVWYMGEPMCSEDMMSNMVYLTF